MADISNNPQYFARKLQKWNRKKNTRQMPWKGEKDPYKIWLSEIILQQTRVEQGLGYYNEMIRKFPDIHQLAKAPEDNVFKVWEGLGYYSRCRNLIATARYISNELNGQFPATFEEIKQLKGIGPYTASAIASFAFNLPYAVVDGNVFRVLARIFGIYTPVDSSEGKSRFAALADQLLDKKNPGEHNQAIMDFGAVICKPAPACNQCVFNKSCFAFLHNKIHELPVKEKKINIRKRWFYYLVMEYKGEIAIRQRKGKDIWQQLYEYPMVEMKKDEDLKTILSQAEKENTLPQKNYETISVSPYYKQQLTHQTITGQFIKIKLKTKPVLHMDWVWLPENKLTIYAFPKFITLYHVPVNSLVLL